MKQSSSVFSHPLEEGEKQCLDSELWHACAGPLVCLPSIGSRVVYFPQGHSEQVAASTNKEVDVETPSYPSLHPQLICQLHNVTMHADAETDEVYAQMTLQPLSQIEQKDTFLSAELNIPNKQPTNYFCKTLTASDTSTHGGFSVPRRAAEKVFPPLDFALQPPAQELIARDLHNNEWKFRHVFRGQPKRHLLTTGWSVFVSAKKLVAGDSVLFIWNQKNELLIGIRRSSRPQTTMPLSVLSSDSMHIGLLAAAAHAAATNSRFTIFFNPRASPFEFVIPLAKYVKTVYHTRVSVGMRFRMLFETEESSVRRYMGTITGISDLDPVRWPNSHWRSVKVGWDESTGGEKQPRVSLWEIEPLTSFPMYPSPFALGLKRPWASGLSSFQGLSGIRDGELGFDSPITWLHNADSQGVQSLNFQGLGGKLPKQPRLDLLGMSPDMYQTLAAAALQEVRNLESLKQASPSLLQLQAQNMPNRSSPQLNQFIQQAQSQSSQPLFHPIQESHPQSQCQAQFKQQLPHYQPFNDQQKILQQQQQHFPDNQRPQQLVIPHSQLPLTSITHSSSLENMAPLSMPLNLPLSDGILAKASSLSPAYNVLGRLSQDETSFLNLQQSNTSISTDPCFLYPKRAAFGSTLLSGNECMLSQVDQLAPLFPMTSQNSMSLPPFPGKECLNNVLSVQGIGRESDSLGAPLANYNFMSSVGADYLHGTDVSASSCMDESVLLHSPENVDQTDPPNKNFVKVYKSRSFGRSLDIARFSSYHQLRSELAQMFGLEGLLEDPLRSGWQLVFVDKENDVLLLGDGPWQEFVNNVWCIKILSPQEAQLMISQDCGLLNEVPFQKPSETSCDDFMNSADSRNMSSGITSVESVDF